MCSDSVAFFMVHKIAVKRFLMTGFQVVAPVEWFPSIGAPQLFSAILLAWLAAEVVNMFVGTRLSAFGQAYHEFAAARPRFFPGL